MSTAVNIQETVRASEHWMAGNRLKLNSEENSADVDHNQTQTPRGGPCRSWALRGARVLATSEAVGVLGVETRDGTRRQVRQLHLI